MNTTPTPPTDEPLRPHTYDGIQEYDKRLPNWWLQTLYIAIVFWAAYWTWYEWFRLGKDGPQTVTAEMAQIEARKLAVTASLQLDDASLWKMSQNAVFIEAGRATFTTNCAACHLASLRGKNENPIAIGPDLTDTKWIHGGAPIQVHDTVTKGVLVKGMPAWGPVLGARKVTEVVAFLLSKHQEGEPVVIDAPAK